MVRDGSLGSGPLEVGPGQGATYLITPEMGEQHGGNLFHSFERFGIGKGETATFTGPDSVDNVISRVTGGVRSQIDGTLSSTIPGADVWLLNPSGVVFGEEAQLDVRGSFHAGTGDSVAFADGEHFSADRARPSVLSTAPPAAFGFLPGSPGESATLAVRRAALEVDPGERLELAGGDVRLTQASLSTAGGHVDLAAQDEVTVRSSRVDVGGAMPGSVSIRGGRIVVERGSQVLAENGSTLPAGSEAPGPGSISIAASESVLVDASLLSVDTSSAGNAGTIHLKGPGRHLPERAGLPGPRRRLRSASDRDGRECGDRQQRQGRPDRHRRGSLTVTNGAAVSADTVGYAATGDAGTIEISTTGEVEISTPKLPGGSAPFSTVSAQSWGSRATAVSSRSTPAHSASMAPTTADRSSGSRR